MKFRKLALAGILLACGGREPQHLQVEVNSVQPWAASPDAYSRIMSQVDRSLVYWQAPYEILDGYTLLLADKEIACGGHGGGCAFVSAGRLDVSTEFGPCVEAAPIAHEIGHVVIPNDPKHLDPHWAGLLSAGLAAGAYQCE